MGDMAMRTTIKLLGIATLIFGLGAAQAREAEEQARAISSANLDGRLARHVTTALKEGQQTFRFDTFGDEAFWGDTLKLHQAIQGARFGGVGEGVSPRQALAAGLKVDLDALPAEVIRGVRLGKVNLDDPAVTLLLLRLNAVLGLKGFFNEGGSLRSIGITCALCHSNVDNRLALGIGRRLDGWANRDLNVGAIIAMAPDLQALADLLDVPQSAVRAVLNSWGPGKFDAALVLDGKAFRPDGRSAAVLIPPAFGLAGVNLHTSVGWGAVSHWNAFVANIAMRGQGTFYDPRLDDPVQYPIAAANGLGHLRSTPDLITSKLPALHLYQLALPSPVAPKGSFDPRAAERGKEVFNGPGKCATCHVPPLFTEPGWNLHTAAEIGIDDFQASRGPDQRYRTAPLKGLWTHQQGGFYHDGRFATLRDVVQHYDAAFGLRLGEPEIADLVEYLKSL
jgi:hypothetical protein